MVGVAAGIPTILALVFAVILAVVCVLRWKNYSWNQVTTSHLLEGLPSITFLLPSLVDLHSRNLMQHPLRLLGSLGPRPLALRLSLLFLSKAEPQPGS